MDGKIISKNYKGKPCLEFISHVIKDMQCDIYHEFKRKTDDRWSGELLPTSMHFANQREFYDYIKCIHNVHKIF